MPDTVVRTQITSNRPIDTKQTLNSGRLSLLLVSLAAVAYCAWILSLPLFPTQDGPMHLYYARIMQALLFHRDPGIFPQYFTIKHLAPPYALYYYLLLTFGHFTSLVVADKLVICVYSVVFLFGFRFLARTLGPSGDAMSLLATLYVLNWPLGMGFVNYCLSVALACWALGLWCRVVLQPTSKRNPLRLAAFVVLAWTIMFTHPVPLLFVLGFCFIELCVRLVQARLTREPVSSAIFRRDAIGFILAATTLLYVKAFTSRNVTQQLDPMRKTYFEDVKAALRGIGNFGTLDAFSPHTLLAEIRRFSIFFILLFALASAGIYAWRSLQHRTWKLSGTWFVLAFILWIGIPFLPPDLNNSHLFSSRLMIFAVLAALAAASGVPAPSPNAKQKLYACAASAIVLISVTLVIAHRSIGPIARDIDRLETHPPIPQGVYLGLLIQDYAKDAPALTYNPYYWDETRLLRRSGSILFDTPWLDLAIIPVGAQPIMPTGRVPSYSLESMPYIRPVLADSAQARAIIYPAITGAIISHGGFPPEPAMDPVLKADPTPAHHWVCAPLAFTQVCEADGKAYNQQQ